MLQYQAESQGSNLWLNPHRLKLIEIHRQLTPFLLFTQVPEGSQTSLAEDQDTNAHTGMSGVLVTGLLRHAQALTLTR